MSASAASIQDDLRWRDDGMILLAQVIRCKMKHFTRKLQRAKPPLSGTLAVEIAHNSSNERRRHVIRVGFHQPASRIAVAKGITASGRQLHGLRRPAASFHPSRLRVYSRHAQLRAELPIKFEPPGLSRRRLHTAGRFHEAQAADTTPACFSRRCTRAAYHQNMLRRPLIIS